MLTTLGRSRSYRPWAPGLLLILLVPCARLYSRDDKRARPGGKAGLGAAHGLGLLPPSASDCCCFSPAIDVSISSHRSLFPSDLAFASSSCFSLMLS